jgi:glycosyltransferase involved in cell wall biosynthesis
MYVLKLGVAKGRVMHINFLGPHTLSFPLYWLLRVMGWRTVVTVHDVLPHKWLLPKQFRFVERLTVWSIYHTAYRLVVHHSTQAKELTNSFGIRAGKIRVIPHGAFALPGAPLPFSKNKEMNVLVFGTIRENKGVDLAIQAVQQLRNRNASVRLKIAGSAHASEKEYWEYCRALIREAPDGIEVWEAFIPDANLPSLFAWCDIVLLPYVKFLSQSGVAVMALSSGRAIVATAVGGLEELIEPGVTGLVIHEATAGSVQKALEDALSKWPEQIERMGRNSYEMFKGRYDWYAVGKQHSVLYQEMQQISQHDRRRQ